MSFESILKGLNQSYDTTDEIANNSGEGGEPVENTGHGAVKEDDSKKTIIRGPGLDAQLWDTQGGIGNGSRRNE